MQTTTAFRLADSTLPIMKVVYSILARVESSCIPDSSDLIPDEIRDRVDVTFQPTLIPPSQEYFWTEEWQQGEQDADFDLRTGATRSFSNSKDAIRWLLGGD